MKLVIFRNPRSPAAKQSGGTPSEERTAIFLDKPQESCQTTIGSFYKFYNSEQEIRAWPPATPLVLVRVFRRPKVSQETERNQITGKKRGPSKPRFYWVLATGNWQLHMQAKTRNSQFQNTLPISPLNSKTWEIRHQLT